MKRLRTFDYNRRLSSVEEDRLVFSSFAKGYVKVAWHAEVVSMEGAHYHFWVPSTIQREERKVFLQECKTAAKLKGDPVSFSWDYEPY